MSWLKLLRWICWVKMFTSEIRWRDRHFWFRLLRILVRNFDFTFFLNSSLFLLLTLFVLYYYCCCCCCYFLLFRLFYCCIKGVFCCVFYLNGKFNNWERWSLSLHIIITVKKYTFNSTCICVTLNSYFYFLLINKVKNSKRIKVLALF